MSSGDVTGFQCGCPHSNAPSPRKKLLPVARHDLQASRVLLIISTINHKRRRQIKARPCILATIDACSCVRITTIRLVLSWRIDRAGSRTAVWIRCRTSQKFKPSNPSFPRRSPRGAPNTVPAPVPYSRERLAFRGGYYCHLQMVLWTCGPARRANHWTCRE